ncbi:hypothetical protein P9148_17460 [Bacillus siamensis]|uniref:hypothetical protein n=1 Tax=Bacillus siamensis TaxID=659243 RepID=UPI002DB5B2E6|nr:hypothetical protein [Bacillus siamensis]MEC3656848.1 hypothetical protein [Bacillus siamensis]
MSRYRYDKDLYGYRHPSRHGNKSWYYHDEHCCEEHCCKRFCCEERCCEEHCCKRRHCCEEHCCKKHCCEKHDHFKKEKKHRSKLKCQESLNEVLLSIAEIENALANAINAQTEVIKKGSFSPDELSLLIDKLENTIKLAIKKEIILELLLEDAVKACEHEKCNKQNN